MPQPSDFGYFQIAIRGFMAALGELGSERLPEATESSRPSNRPYATGFSATDSPELLESPRSSSEESAWGSSGKDARYLSKLGRLLGKSDEQDRKLILHMAKKMANR